MPRFTPSLRLTLPDFDQSPWDTDVNGNFGILDAAYGKLTSIPGLTGAWKNSTAYTVGQSAVDPTDGIVYSCQVAHTSAPVPTTFAQDRSNHPTFWSSTSSIQPYLPTTGGVLTGTLGIDTPAGKAKTIQSFSGGKLRWAIDLGDASTKESFAIYRYNDAGAYIDTPLSSDRQTGSVSVKNDFGVGGIVFANEIDINGPIKFVQSGGYIGITPTVVQFVFDNTLWRWVWNRVGGALQYVRGSDNTILFNVDGNGNTGITGQFFIQGNGIIYEQISTSNAFEFYYSAPNAVMRINGITDIVVGTISDQTMKDNIAPSVFDCLQAVLATPLFQYNWKSTGQFVPIGFVAQQQNTNFVFPTSPEAGQADPPATQLKQMDYNAVCAALCGAIQQQSVMITDLQTRVTALEAAAA